MDLTAFNSRLGISQGRIPLESTESFVFVLGDDVPGYYYDLEAGDYAQVVQAVDLADIDLIRTELDVEVPESIPSRFGYEISIVVNDVKLETILCKARYRHHITDLAANVSIMTGVQLVGVRLEVVRV